MKKRIFALALALCMMLSAMPTSFAGNGFLTLDNGEQEPSEPSGILTPGDPVLPEEDLSGEPHLTLDDPAEGSQPAPDDPIDEPHLTLDDPVDEPEDRPAHQWRPAPFEEETFTQCDICGYLDGSHAVDCPVVNPPEEQAPAQSTIAEYKPAPMSAATYQDIYDSMMSAETLAEYKAELNALSADLQEAFFSLLTVEEREALSEREDSLAHDALTVTGAENATRTVTVEARASAFSFALHEALRQLGQDLIVSIYGRILESIDLPQNDYTMLETITPTDGARYQWQIQADDDLWVDIYHETGSIIRVSYAMVASLLDRYDAVQVRCEITGEDGVSYTDPVKVSVDYTSEDVYIDAEEEPIEPVILDEGKVEITQGQPVEPEAPAGPEETTEPEDTAEPATPAEPEDTSAPENTADPVAQSFSVTRLGGVYAQNFSVRQLTGGTEDTTDDTPSTPSTPSTYNVVVNYVFESGDIVADPYTASLAAGSSFSATVNFPTVQGYLPYVDEVQQNSIELNYTSIDQNYTYNVVYKPTNVDYTVIHYQQNLNDDNYTEAERETKQGLTNSTVPEVAHVRTGADGNVVTDPGYEGFYALLYEKPAIAADGSTVVEVYYDRYYYLMNFDLDGGYGVEPIYARYGTPIGDVGTPTKAGYTFTGWTLNGTDATIPDTMPAENRTYKAVWQAENTAKVTVVFWGENADDEAYSYIRSMQVDAKPGESYSFDGSSLACPLAEHSHNDSELNCTHTHTLDCYSTYFGFTKTEKPTNALPDNENGIYTYTTGRYGKKTTHYYLNIGDNWYFGTDYSGDRNDERQIEFDCKHTHTDECYGCGLIAHAHSSDCSGLWTFVKSDTVTVAADGSTVVNVYYDRTEKALTFKYKYSNGNYQSTETITAKWGSDISEQYKKIAANAGSTFWSAETSGDGPYTNYFGVMPETSATYYNRGKSGSEGTMTYWGQDLNGEYTVKLFEVTGVGGYYVSDEDRYEFAGYTYDHGTRNKANCKGAAFYYTRNSYTLTFNDGYNVKTESVKYGAPLSTYVNYKPDVPSAYEPGSVTFGGWYLNPECTGEEYKLNERTMPADNVLLYAKWVPVNHKVEFYLDKTALDAGTKLEGYGDITVPHGSLTNPTPEAPTNGNYTFVGWFYMEDGVEKAFDFANMPVTKDLQVYGKWSSNVLKEYTVYYKIQGTDTEIAAPTTGSGLAGVTKTFEAKGGTDLYADYQEGYFPVTKSHSMTLDINATEENDTNVYIFWYVEKPAVPYTVHYYKAGTTEKVHDDKVVSENKKAVVTETFVPVSGMMPDAYQKRLVVSVDENGNPDTEHNVIIFYYTKDTTHAYYKISHYTENLAKDAQGNTTWAEYASSQAVGDIGTTYTADPMTISGFTYDSTVTGTVTSGELTANGLELKLYYTRNSYPYQVRYLEEGSGKQLAEPKNGTGKYGEVISESGAIDITNYDAVDPTSQTLNIRIEEGTEAKLNIITFYYKEKEATINYVSIGPDGAILTGDQLASIGNVTPTSEKVKVITGYASGSIATLTGGPTYKFVGWYSNSGCTDLVSETEKYIPNQPGRTSVTQEDGIVQTTNGLWPETTTYYAKFEYNLTDLTITKVWGGNPCYYQDAIFTVQGKGLKLKVVITVPDDGNTNSVTITGLTVGQSYTVTEDSGWSWRYTATSDPENGQITLVANKAQNKIVFTNTLSKIYWLDDSDHKKNKFGVPNGN